MIARLLLVLAALAFTGSAYAQTWLNRIQAKAAPTNQFMTGVNTAGLPIFAQPQNFVDVNVAGRINIGAGVSASAVIGGDFYSAVNATYDGASWNRTDTAAPAWLWQYGVATNMPGEGYKAATLWRAEPGANPVGAYSTVGGWTLVKSFGPNGETFGGTLTATGDQTDRSAEINAALASRKIVQLGCGDFYIQNTLLLPSKSTLAGMGRCSRVIAKPGVSSPVWGGVPGGTAGAAMMVDNATIPGGNTGIVLRDLELDGSAYTSYGHLAAFYAVDGAEVRRVSFVGGSNVNVGDGVAFVASKNYLVAENSCSKVKTACYDNWDGVSAFRIVGNTIDGDPATSSYGILVNGLSTAATAATSRDGVVANNIVAGVAQGVFVGGLRSGAQVGKVENIAVTGNSLDAITYHGIRFSDGEHLTASGNTVKSAGWNCLLVGAEGPGSSPTRYMTITGNTFNNCGGGGSTYSAMSFYNGASDIAASGNAVSGSTHDYAVKTDSTTANISVAVGPLEAGTTGLASILGASNSVRGLADINLGLTSGFNKTSDATLACVSQMQPTVQPGTYRVRFTGYASHSAAGGAKMSLGGTATVGTVRFAVRALASGTAPTFQAMTALGGALSSTGAAASQWTIDGQIIVTAAGTLCPTFAQAASDATASSLSVGAEWSVVRSY